MAFDGLAEKLQNAMKKLTGKGRLTENDVKVAMREVKMALLEADVNFLVVKNFIKTVQTRATGSDILESLTPGQQVIKIVREELTNLLGTKNEELNIKGKSPAVIMMVGLQGAGKTTFSAKLANHLKKQGKDPLLVACDIYRPAAIEQLKVLGKSIDVRVFENGDANPVQTAKSAIKLAKSKMHDVVIIDTAGRLHIDTDMMNELKDIRGEVKPDEILLVVDAMTGQVAVDVAKSFDEEINITGVIMAKLDSDTRGGAALSISATTQKPIKFAGVGEKIKDIEVFHPDRMASRILGMGDVLSIIEKAESAFDEKKAKEMEYKLRKQQFTFDDFLDQLEQVKKMGGLGSILNMMPNMNSKALKGVNVDDRQMARTEAIIKSMTKQERTNPNVLNASRRKRIAAGSGTQVSDVNKLVKSFLDMKKMMKQFSNKKGKGRRGMNGFPRMPF